MKNFIEKIAYYDGSDYLKKSIATKTSKQKGSPLIFAARKLLKQVPQTISNIKSKEHLYQYICDDEVSKKDFDLLSSLQRIDAAIKAISATEKNPNNKQAYDITTWSLKRAISGIKSTLAEAYTEITDAVALKKMTQVDADGILPKLRNKIDGAPAPSQPATSDLELSADPQQQYLEFGDKEAVNLLSSLPSQTAQPMGGLTLPGPQEPIRPSPVSLPEIKITPIELSPGKMSEVGRPSSK